MPAREEAMNLAGQAYMDQGEYWAAYQRFEDQVAAYPNGAFFDRALDREYKIADAFLKGKKRRAMKILMLSAKDEGIDILLRISTHSPNSELGQKSLIRVADYHFNNGDYKDAINTYEDFEKQYPKSPRRAYAMLQTAKAYVNSYKGIMWDDTPLVDAKRKYEIFAAAYPKMAKSENVPETLKQIYEIRAHKVYNTAEFYKRVHRTDAALYYYQKTVDEFPNTQWAETAKEMLSAMSPDKTPQQRREIDVPETRLEKPKRRYGLVEELEQPTSAPAPTPVSTQAPAPIPMNMEKPSAKEANSAEDVIVPMDKMDFDMPSLSNSQKELPGDKKQPQEKPKTPATTIDVNETNTQPAPAGKTPDSESPIRLEDLRKKLRNN
jgi:outer membrane assembly lipoprotein YfiO